MILSKDITPQDVKKLSLEEKKQLCAEIRAFIIETVSKTGGHLASNLGTVELCVALHSVFTTPEDKLVFDVGHQAYTHKILTGRLSEFGGLRTENGISGFPRPDESEHDAFIGGHASNSISAALGIATAMQLNGDQHHVVAVIGDGALTGGLAYEGLNNAAKLKKNFIVILNDNEMSISKNSGAVASYLTQVSSTTKYFETKSKVKETLSRTAIGRELSKSVSGTKELVKLAIYQSNIFENLGFRYLGPVNGNSLKELIEILNVAKMYDEPCIVHIKTKKGKGYLPAEKNSGAYHGIPKSGSLTIDDDSFSEQFGRSLAAIAQRDEKICAVTAAMKYSTGLHCFSKMFKNRFFDVGIAEEHAVTFSCGLASQGFIPVFVVYSTFLQRTYDQILHDAAIEKYHIVLAVDRAGIVGDDGETHQGLFDVSMLSSVPNTAIYSPSNLSEMRYSMKKALYDESGIAAVRYPKGKCDKTPVKIKPADFMHYDNLKKKLIVTYGRLTDSAKKIFEDKCCDVLQLIKIYPIPEEALAIAGSYSEIHFFEEGIKQGGIAEKMLCSLSERDYIGDYKIHAVDSAFVEFGDTGYMLAKYGLDESAMRKAVGEPYAD